MITTTRRQLMAAMILTGATGVRVRRARPAPRNRPRPEEPWPSPTRSLPVNFPDPLIITGPDGAPTEDGHYWAYATNGNGANVQTL